MDYLIPKIERYKKFFQGPGRGKLLIQTTVKGQSISDCRLSKEDISGNWKDKIVKQMEDYALFLKERKTIDDDWIPMFHPWTGVAEHVWYLYNEDEVIFDSDTSYVFSKLKTIDEVDSLKLDENNIWWNRHKDILYFCKDHAEGRFFVTPRGTYSPLDIANTLLGNDILYDFYDNPDGVNHLLDFCVKAAVLHMKRQMDIFGTYMGGTFSSYHNIWIPGNVAAHVSNDIACLLSTDLYKLFGKPADEEFYRHFDGGGMHSHNLGWHLFPLFFAIDKLLFLEIADDPKVIPTCLRLNELLEMSGDKTVIIYLKAKEVLDHIKELKRGNVIIRVGEELTEAEALELIAFVRRHSN